MTVRIGLRTVRPPKAFHLRVLGGLSLTRGERPVTGPASQRRHRAVLAVLAVHGKTGISREKLAALLWPESNEANARNSLKQALHVLRQEIGRDATSGTTELRLNPVSVSCDLAEFERLLADNSLEAAAEVYSGHFLDGFHLGGDAAEFDHWVDIERARLERQYLEAAETLAQRAAKAGDPGSALRWWRRLSDHAPLDSRYVGRVAAAHLALDDQAGALRHIETHRAALERELDLPLGAELEQLVTTIRAAPQIAALPSTDDRAASLEALETAPALSDAPPAVPAPPVSSGRRVRSLRILAVAGCAGVIVALGAWASTLSRERRTPVDAYGVAVLSTRGRRDDAAADTLARMLASTIARRLTAGTRARVIALPPAREEDARASAHGASAQLLVLVSSLAPTGPLEVTVSNTGNGEQLWNERIDAGAARTSARVSLDSLAERAATAVAVRLDANLANWIDNSSSPTSLDAYREFGSGLALYVDIQPSNAALHFVAAARDTGFTMALVLAAWANVYAGQAHAADSIVRSLQPRRLPTLDRALVNHLAAVLSHNLAAEYEASLAVSAAAPRSEWRYLQAESALRLGRSGETVRVLDEVGPDRGWLRGSSGYWTLLERALHHLGKYDRELSIMTLALARFPADRILIQGKLKALAALGRLEAVDSTIDYALTLRPKGNWGDTPTMDQAVLELNAHGQKAAAQRLARRTLDWMRVQPSDDQKAWTAAVPEFLYYAGAPAEARRQLERLRATEPDDDANLTLLAVICVEQGDRPAAEKIDRQLARIADPARRADILMDRASIAASLGDGPTAVGMIRDAYRAGYGWRSVIHLLWGFDRIRGYPPFEALIGPVE
jgi:DNA-binding SARP family transcriptional activator/tetratricopeptide (TPR) repeat protein